MTNTPEYQRARYLRLKSARTCVKCAKNPAAHGGARCEPCRTKGNEQVKRRKEALRGPRPTTGFGA